MKRSKKLLVSLLLGCAFTIVGGVSIITARQNATAESVTFTLEEVDSLLIKSFVLGDTLELPVVTCNGQTTDCLIISPSGEGYMTNILSLTEVGKYTLIFRCEIGGKSQEERRYFNVDSHLLSVSNENSSIEYGKVSAITGYTAGDKYGAVVRIASKDNLTYNRVLDLSENGRSDSIVDFSVLPNTIGVADAQKIVLTLTDYKDTSNFVTVYLKQCGTGVAWKEEWTYCTAGAANQDQQGLELNKGSYMLDGIKYKRHINSALYGAGVKFSLSAMPQYNNGIKPELVGTQNISFSLDYATKRIYLNNTLVIDLDEATCQSNLWQGFTDGKCFLSIRGENYSAATLNLSINKMDGLDYNVPTVAPEVFMDTQAPVLSIEEGIFDKVSYAVIGKPFRIPTATAFDEYDGERKVAVNVYNSYGMQVNGKNAQVNVRVDNGAFVPTREIIYTIEYITADTKGNRTVAIYNILAKLEGGVDKISLTYGAPATMGILGQEIALGVPQVENANGDYTVIVTAHQGEEKIEVGRYEENTLEMPIFRPLNVGEWTITYTFNDYVLSGETSYTLHVSAEGATAVFPNEPKDLPKYVIKGATYKTPVLYGYKFINGKGVQEKAISYVTDTPSIVGAVPQTDTFTVTADTCYLTYVLDDVQKQIIIPVADVGYGKKESFHAGKYFTGYVTLPTADSEGADYTISCSNAKTEFVNALQTFDMSFLFKVGVAPTYKAVKVTLTDATNCDNQISVTYQRNVFGNISVLYNGNCYDMANVFDGGNVKFGYNGNTNILTAFDGLELSVAKNTNGENWKGFSAQSAWLSVEFIDATADCEFSVVSLNGVLFNATNIGKDSSRPQAEVISSPGNNKMGSTVILSIMHIADLFDPNIQITLKVTDPSGKTVKSLDGVSLNGAVDISRTYEISLDQIGTYVVKYDAQDVFGNKLTKQQGRYVISVVDTAPPVITFNNPVTEVKSGEEVSVAEVTIKDETTVEITEIYYYVQTPSYVFTKIEKTFVAEEKGTYKVWCMAFDEQGNCGMMSYTVTVS